MANYRIEFSASAERQLHRLDAASTVATFAQKWAAAWLRLLGVGLPLLVAAARRRVRAPGVSAVVGVAMLAAAPPAAYARDVQVAVAANFTAPARELGELFTQSTGHTARFSFGSTGRLYAQITQGAPYEVFLAADRVHPHRAGAEGFAVPDSANTYATGRLVLYSSDAGQVAGGDTLARDDYSRLAIANPALAPYGVAAVAALKALGVYDRVRARLVYGNNVAQAYQFVATGNAELGLVALAQIVNHAAGSRWLIPEELYPAIAQDAVLLRLGADNPAARAFLAFLSEPAARAVILRYGYAAGTSPAHAQRAGDGNGQGGAHGPEQWAGHRGRQGAGDGNGQGAVHAYARGAGRGNGQGGGHGPEQWAGHRSRRGAAHGHAQGAGDGRGRGRVAAAGRGPATAAEARRVHASG